MPEQLLSIVIPCFNEKQHIEALVARVLAAPIERKEVIIVDDCSNDGTRQVLREKIEPQVAKVIYQEHNGGKGAAVRAGIAAATGDALIIQDADFEYDPQEYPKVVGPVFSGVADVCYGSRFSNGLPWKSAYWQNILANRFLTILSNCFTGLKLTDMETCYKVFRTDIIKGLTLFESRFGIEPEITAKIAKTGCRVHEVPISYSPRLKAEGKKIGFKDGLQAIGCILKYH